MSEKLLTIAIPAYNMEKYLHRCIDSILCPAVMDDVEVIIVNDGSSDSTSQIIHDYEIRYPRYIKAIDKDNGNYGSVMNRVLKEAKGKYFRTLDSDDWYETKAFEKFVSELVDTKADMLICERFEFFEKSSKKEHIQFDDEFVLDKDIQVRDDLWKNKIIRRLTHVSSVVYKTDLLRRSGLEWSENVFYTDNEYLFWPLDLVKTVRLMSTPVYVYFIGRNDQSVSITSIKKNFSSFNVVTTKLLNAYLNNRQVNKDVITLRKKILVVDLLPNFYLTLIVSGFKNHKKVDIVESLLKENDFLLGETAAIHNYRNIRYVDAYRNNRIKYYLILLDYKLRSSSLLRRIFGKE